MAYPKTIRNFNAFIDGVGWFGRCEEGKLPEIALKTAAHRAAGMDGVLAIDMGIEAMQAETTFAEWAPEHFRQFGRRPRITLRAGALGEESFDADAWAFEMRGRLARIAGDPLKAGPEAKLKLGWEVDYFRVEFNGEDLLEIDVENGKRVIGGEDQLASMRRAMGV